MSEQKKRMLEEGPEVVQALKRSGLSQERFAEKPGISVRKNFLFVGYQEARENLAILQTLVST